MLASLATLAVVLLENVQNELGDFLAWKAPANEMARFYLAYTLVQLPLIVPLALLLSQLFVLGDLHRAHEITAMRAAGRGVLSITRSLWLAALVLATLLVVLKIEGVPWGVRTTQALRQAWQLRASSTAGTADAGMVAPLGYHHETHNRIWLMNRFNRATNEGFGVSVYQMDHRGRETLRLLARVVYFDEVQGHWIALDGRMLTFDPASGQAIRQDRFERQEVLDWRESPQTMLALQADPARLTLWELQAVLASSDETSGSRMRTYALRYQRTLAQPVDVLLVTLVAVPLAVAGVRRNPWVNLSRVGLLLAIYFGLSRIAGLLAEQGHLPIAVAIWAPPGVLLLTVLPLYRRLY